MQLKTFSYSEFEGRDQEWKLDGLVLGPRNLMVGKNASGKSRTVSVILALSNHLAGLAPAGLSGNFDAVFTEGNDTFKYKLKYEEMQVTFESYFKNDDPLLERGEGGEGRIWAEEIDGGSHIRFQSPPSDIAAVARRDTIQHKFLEPLYLWGSSLRYYAFGSNLGKHHYAYFVDKGGIAPNERDQNAVVALFRLGEKQFPDTFTRQICADMIGVDYDIESIGVAPPVSARFVGPPGSVPPDMPAGLFVKEKSLKGITDQNSMSQGMFRVLSLLVHVNYAQFSKHATCILVDDIGEGLDFDRSCRLIDILRKKTEESNIQLTMATNDRFVMNKVPLNEWSVVNRQGGVITIKNHLNSQKIFEEFEFTGLSNFSFFEMDIANDPDGGSVPDNA